MDSHEVGSPPSSLSLSTNQTFIYILLRTKQNKYLKGKKKGKAKAKALKKRNLIDSE